MIETSSDGGECLFLSIVSSTSVVRHAVRQPPARACLTSPRGFPGDTAGDLFPFTGAFASTEERRSSSGAGERDSADE